MDVIKKNRYYLYIIGLVVPTSILIRMLYGEEIRASVMDSDLPILMLVSYGFLLWYIFILFIGVCSLAVIVGIIFILNMFRKKIIDRTKASSYKKKKFLIVFVNVIATITIIAFIGWLLHTTKFIQEENCDIYSGTDYSRYYDSVWGQQTQFNKCNDSLYCKVEYTEPYDFYGPRRGARSYRCVPK